MAERLARLADDLLVGAGAIAEEVFGVDNPKNRRRIYHLHETSAIPTFLFGKQVALRLSRLNKKIDDSEREHVATAQ
jgi:hypothetical protein